MRFHLVFLNKRRNEPHPGRGSSLARTGVGGDSVLTDQQDASGCLPNGWTVDGVGVEGVGVVGVGVIVVGVEGVSGRSGTGGARVVMNGSLSESTEYCASRPRVGLAGGERKLANDFRVFRRGLEIMRRSHMEGEDETEVVGEQGSSGRAGMCAYVGVDVGVK